MHEFFQFHQPSQPPFTRRQILSFDEPIGDPFGGPAYGLRQEPVSATFAAVFLGGAAVTAATVFAAISYVGLAFTIVGAVTGNKTLSKIGGVLGIVGGVGGLATSLGGAAATGAAEATQAGQLAAQDAAFTGGSGALDSLTADAYISNFPAEAATNAASSSSNILGGAPSTVAAGGDAAASIDPLSASQSSSFLEASAPAAPSVGGVADVAGATAPAATVVPGSGGGFFDGISDIFGKGGVLGKDSGGLEIAKLGAGFLSGQGKGRAEEDLVRLKQAEFDERTRQDNLTRSNANAQPTNIGNLRYSPNPNLFLKPPQPVNQFTSGLIRRAQG